MKVNIGKNTLGDNNKMSVSLREYGRSTHDLSYAWRSPMGVGTLVPFMKLLALPGDTFDIDLDTKVLTHPTVGPLFGQFKMQLDVFTCPIRLYQAQLHNNALNIGLDMKKVKLPKFKTNMDIGDDPEPGKIGRRYGKGSLAEYLGIRYEPYRKGGPYGGNVNAVPFFAYYDVFKNFYANKQEDYFMIMGGGVIVGSGKVTTKNTVLYRVDNAGLYINRNNAQGESANRPVEFTISKELWEASKKENTVTLYYDVDTEPMSIKINAINSYVETETESDGLVTVTCRNASKLVFTDKELTAGVHTATGKTWTSSQGIWVPAYTSSYKLEEIDNLREYILKQGKKEILIKANSKEEWIGTSFIKDVLTGVNTADDSSIVKKSIIQMEMGGLCLKTLQSDIFNNWVNKEWVDGDNGIKAITDVAVTDGKLNLDSLNIAQKVYNMLNRIAVSGGSYKDWIETVYTTDYYFRAETPVYEGGMSTIIDFEAVVSNSASTASGVEEPLGSLAGRGYNGQKKGGRIKIKINEPCYIMGIASITPLVDYSQGNDWDCWLETMDDLHKPQLDGIGYQDLMQNKMHGLANPTLAVGKQPAWLDYMTNFNKTFADFAAGEEESYMVLNRIYNVDSDGQITNATTYINPKDYTYIFATNTETNRDFWVQIGCGVTARRVMSAAQIPLM